MPPFFDQLCIWNFKKERKSCKTGEEDQRSQN